MMKSNAGPPASAPSPCALLSQEPAVPAPFRTALRVWFPAGKPGWARVHPVRLENSVGLLCRKPYAGHPRGCPNFGRDSCPPNVPPYWEQIDEQKPIYVVWNAFPLAAHVDCMRRRHPTWSDRQLRCCLYWQGTARKFLRAALRDFLRYECYPHYVIGCPEAAQVNVTATMKTIGTLLEWPPVQYAYQIAMVGWERMPTKRIPRTAEALIAGASRLQRSPMRPVLEREALVGRLVGAIARGIEARKRAT